MSGAIQLVASAAFVGSELMAEFGPIPPAFLPLGNRRLFTHQFAALGVAARRRLLSVPAEFALDEADDRWLAEAGIEIVRVPRGLTVGQSLIHVIEATASVGESIAILYGDTLIRGAAAGDHDVATVSTVEPDLYEWGHVRIAAQRLLPASATHGQPAVLTGFFRFGDTAGFVGAVKRQGGDIVRGVLDYAESRQVRAAEAAQWLDFGHATTYHRSRRQVSTAREFNRVVSGRRSITKSGSDAAKIEAEARWFETLPAPLRLYGPAYLGRVVQPDGRPAYALEYLNHPTLADLFVFGRLRAATWERIFGACDEILSRFADHRDPSSTPPGVGYLDKTRTRIEAYARATGIADGAPCRSDGRALPSLTRIAEIAAAAIPGEPPRGATLLHGDFCFSNLLYDLRGDVVKAIDPRGLDMDGRATLYGDLRYDIGKLHHSVIGQYDHIVAGQFRLRRDGPLDVGLELPESEAISTVQSAFLQRTFAGLGVEAASSLPMSILLFLSMLPLHADDPLRQAALLANGLRLFVLFDQGRGPSP